MPDIDTAGKTILGVLSKSDYVKFVLVCFSAIGFLGSMNYFLANMHLNDDRDFKIQARINDSLHTEKEKYLESENQRLHNKVEDLLTTGTFKYEQLKAKTDSLKPQPHEKI